MSEQSTQAIKAHNLYRDLPFMLEQWQEEILCTRIADLLREHEELAIGGVMRIRCLNHITTPQQNANEFNGGECGACIAEERDDLKAKLSEAEKANALAVAKIDEQRRTYDFHLAERMQLQDRCEALEKALRDALPILKGCQCLGSDGSRKRHRIVDKANAALAGKDTCS